jgi:hypothetical protein
LKIHNIFISHAWEYNSEYHRIVSFLDSRQYFYWKNYSVPEHDPKIDPDSKMGYRKLRDELENQIKLVNCFIIIGRMYINNRVWLQTEMDLAYNYNKPIVAVIPFGARQVPQAIKEIANEIVGWNKASIVNAIRRNSI